MVFAYFIIKNAIFVTIFYIFKVRYCYFETINDNQIIVIQKLSKLCENG